MILGRKSLYGNAGNDHQWDQIQQLDNISVELGRGRFTAPAKSNAGILERGFDSLLEPPPRVSSLKPPPGLEYTPS